MTIPARPEHQHERFLNVWYSGSETLRNLAFVKRSSNPTGALSDSSAPPATFLPADQDVIQDVLRVRTNHTRPMTPLEQLTLEDLIEDALLLCVASRVACKGNLYEITMYGDRYTLTPRQALAFLGGAVEAHRARWRLSAATN